MAFWNKEKPRAHTNAPKHWPAVQLDQFDNPGINLLLIGGELAQLSAPPRSTIAFMRDFLYEDGILQVPIVVEENGVKTGVFVYSNHDKDAAAQYLGRTRASQVAREHRRRVLRPGAARPDNAGRRPAGHRHIDVLEMRAGTAGGELRALVGDTQDYLFSRSEDRALLDRWFEAVEGYGYVIFTGFVTDLDLEQEKKDKVFSLPSPVYSNGRPSGASPGRSGSTTPSGRCTP